MTPLCVPSVLCSMSFHDPEGYIDSTDYPPLPLHGYLQCTYNVTVYTGYGVELQVSPARGDPHSQTRWSLQKMMAPLPWAPSLDTPFQGKK